MKDEERPGEEMIAELNRVRREVAKLERSEADSKRLEEVLSNSETQFKKITEKSMVGVYLIQDDVFQYVNPRMAQIFGYEVNDLIHRRGPRDLVLPEDWPLVRENLRKRLSGEEESINYAFRGIKRDGEVVYHEVYGSRTDYRDRPAVIGTMLDITHRVEAERNMQMQLHRFQVLYRIAMAMAAEHTLEENLRLLVEQCRELLDTHVSLIAVSDGNPKFLRVLAQSGFRAQLVNLPGELLTKHEVESFTSKTGGPAEIDFKVLNTVAKNDFRREGLMSGLAYRFRIRDRHLGVLCAGSRTERVFSEPEKYVLSLMANMASLEVTRKQAEEALAQSENQLRLLSKQLLKAQEDDRKRLAQELHDGIGQSLSAIKFRLETAAKQVSDDASGDGRAQLGMLVSMIQGTINEVRQIAMDLRPSVLDDLGLVATFSWFLREFQSTYCDMKLDKRIVVEESDVPEPLKIVIFRVAQEALNNVAKHSRADVVQVALAKRKGRIVLTIKDNGAGFDGNCSRLSWSHGRGFGLTGMKERTELSGGMFKLDTGPGLGTSIKASWPLKAPATSK